MKGDFLALTALSTIKNERIKHFHRVFYQVPFLAWGPPRGLAKIGALLKRNWSHKLNLIDTWTISATTSMEVYKDNKWEFKF